MAKRQFMTRPTVDISPGPSEVTPHHPTSVFDEYCCDISHRTVVHGSCRQNLCMNIQTSANIAPPLTSQWSISRLRDSHDDGCMWALPDAYTFLLAMSDVRLLILYKVALRNPCNDRMLSTFLPSRPFDG